MVNKTPKTKNGKLEKVNATNITNKDLVILDKGLILLKISKEDFYDDRWKLNFWWWAHCSVYRRRNIMLYTWNLHNVINQLTQ